MALLFAVLTPRCLEPVCGPRPGIGTFFRTRGTYDGAITISVFLIVEPFHPLGGHDLAP